MVKKYFYLTISLCLLISPICLVTTNPIRLQETPAKPSRSKEKGAAPTAPESLVPEKLSATHHSIKVNGQTLHL